MRYLALLLIACGAPVAACGGTDPAARVATRPAPEPATLVAFQRDGGLAATLDALTVRADGSARLDKRYGGAGRRTSAFRLTPVELTRLRAALRALPRRIAATPGGAADAATYLLTYRGRALSAREDALPAHGASAFRLLAALVDRGAR
jgi:hypothetical protein